MSGTGATWDISAFDPRELGEKLADYYGVEGPIRYQGDWYDAEQDEMLYEVLLYRDGEDLHLIADEVPVHGHGPTGAMGVWVDELPDKETVRAVVDAVEGGNDD